MPAPETVDFEREFEEIVRQLRALPAEAPPELRQRVRSLGEPEPRRFALPQLTWRRTLVVLAPACAAALLAAAAVHGLLSSSGGQQQLVAGQTTPTTRAGHGSSGARLAPQEGFSQDKTLALPSSRVPAPNTSRHQDYQADLRVRVSDFDALGKRSAEAMRITQQLGGYVASVSQTTTAGHPGEADLVLRVPVARVQDAMIRLSALGTVLSQNVSIVDLENVVRQQRARIQSLRLRIVRLVAALQQPGLAPDVKLRLQFQLDNVRRALSQATRSNKATLREAAMSRISLSLTTEKAAAAKQHKSRLHTSVGAAVDFLAAAGAIALAALIVVSPLAVLAVLLFWGVRTYRRREAQRLLGPA